MSPGANAAAELLARTGLVVHRGPFALGAWIPAQASAVFAGLLRGNERLAAVVLDEHEATALIREKSLLEMPPPRQLERGWAVITLDQAMDWDVVGVLAAVTGALAAAHVPLGAATAFSRDHILVHRDRLEDALAALQPLCGKVTVRD